MSRTVAVIGASTRRAKFGNKSVRAHQQAGWTVYPVNPTADEIEGLTCTTAVADLPEGLDRVTLYVPAAVIRQMLPDLAARKPAEVFFNPGTDDPDVIAEAQAAGLNTVTGCSIIDVGFTPADFPDA